ncbi:helix-turn-helix domain-containing protein [Ammonicoccus fulvus]|uniref:Helix-turn-helix domain-containing protein n=1 Tax=Ammonicoccus fulvus TaxID=3138240 RepID=A0ABZ3FSI6_9ACTN
MGTLPPVRFAQEMGFFVRERRESLGLTQADIADRVGVGRVWYVQFEGGLKDGVRLDVLLRILRVLGAEVTLRPLIEASPE